jgi:hypothetical protein
LFADLHVDELVPECPDVSVPAEHADHLCAFVQTLCPASTGTSTSTLPTASFTLVVIVLPRSIAHEGAEINELNGSMDLEGGARSRDKKSKGKEKDEKKKEKKWGDRFTYDGREAETRKR